ncbi:MAG: hypothetical protein ACK4OM_02090 [Alphaproteobacteria bacterium]
MKQVTEEELLEKLKGQETIDHLVIGSTKAYDKEALSYPRRLGFGLQDESDIIVQKQYIINQILFKIMSNKIRSLSFLGEEFYCEEIFFPVAGAIGHSSCSFIEEFTYSPENEFRISAEDYSKLRSYLNDYPSPEKFGLIAQGLLFSNLKKLTLHKMSFPNDERSYPVSFFIYGILSSQNLHYLDLSGSKSFAEEFMNFTDFDYGDPEAYKGYGNASAVKIGNLNHVIFNDMTLKGEALNSVLNFFKYSKNLEILSLNKNSIDNNDLIYFKDYFISISEKYESSKNYAFGSKYLQSLSLEDNEIDDKGASDLIEIIKQSIAKGQIPFLGEISLKGNPISQEKIGEINALLKPNLLLNSAIAKIREAMDNDADKIEFSYYEHEVLKTRKEDLIDFLRYKKYSQEQIDNSLKLIKNDFHNNKFRRMGISKHQPDLLPDEIWTEIFSYLKPSNIESHTQREDRKRKLEQEEGSDLKKNRDR